MNVAHSCRPFNCCLRRNSSSTFMKPILISGAIAGNPLATRQSRALHLICSQKPECSSASYVQYSRMPDFSDMNASKLAMSGLSSRRSSDDRKIAQPKSKTRSSGRSGISPYISIWVWKSWQSRAKATTISSLRLSTTVFVTFFLAPNSLIDVDILSLVINKYSPGRADRGFLRLCEVT